MKIAFDYNSKIILNFHYNKIGRMKLPRPSVVGEKQCHAHRTQEGQLAFPWRLCSCACALWNFLSHVFPVKQTDARGLVRWRRTEAELRYPAPSAPNHNSFWLSAHRTGDYGFGIPRAKLYNRNTCLPRT